MVTLAPGIVKVYWFFVRVAVPWVVAVMVAPVAAFVTTSLSSS